MPWTPAQNRLFHAAASGHSTHMSADVGKKLLAEHAPVRKDVDKSGHAFTRTKGKKK